MKIHIFLQQKIILIVIFCFLTVPLYAEKIDFWNTQRKGGNNFNVVPTKQWFQDASELGLEWVRLTYVKWKGENRDFLLGNASNYNGLVETDLQKLIQVLGWAQEYNIKIVVTPVSLPGARWNQKNAGKFDERLWNDKKYWSQSFAFWQELAKNLKDNPAVYGYNIINEPSPERSTNLKEHGDPKRYIQWYKEYKGTAHDLPLFYKTVIAAIRKIDAQTPIMLDAGWYAQPHAFSYWPKINDTRILYSFHMYEPFAFTSHFNFQKKKNLQYPGTIPFANKEVYWDKQKIENYLQTYFNWAQSHNIPKNRLVVGEYGCYRRNEGCQQYLEDVLSVFNKETIHWAFYSFREDEWDGYDYEVGTKGLGWDYWKAKDAGQSPEIPRKNNPLFDVVKKEF